MIIKNYQDFMEEIYSRLENLGIDTSALIIDHIGYQADSVADYEKHVKALGDSCQKVDEHIVGGRRVGIFTVDDPFEFRAERFNIFEIFEPKAGQQAISGWEHIEFLVPGTLEEYMTDYPDLDWDTYALDREEFPMLILNLGDNLRAKFPRLGVLEETARIS